VLHGRSAADDLRVAADLLHPVAFPTWWNGHARAEAVYEIFAFPTSIFPTSARLDSS
jgi:hypothetical protein